jgi:hypothetical protein
MFSINIKKNSDDVNFVSDDTKSVGLQKMKSFNFCRPANFVPSDRFKHLISQTIKTRADICRVARWYIRTQKFKFGCILESLRAEQLGAHTFGHLLHSGHFPVRYIVSRKI